MIQSKRSVLKLYVVWAATLQAELTSGAGTNAQDELCARIGKVGSDGGRSSLLMHLRRVSIVDQEREHERA